MEVTLDQEALLLGKLSKDLREAARRLTVGQVRYLVDRYYQLQDDRKRSEAQILAAEEGQEPSAFLRWDADIAWKMESSIKKALDYYTDEQPVGRWLKSVYGIGPVISAGFLAHIDIERAPTVGHIWRFAGLDPTVTWNKKQKRPWNARLKVLCWKAGESFVKFHARPECIYGHIYEERKVLENTRNESGQFREQAEAALASTKFGDDTQAKQWYLQGKLPPARIHARAKRYAVKLFLSHLHHVWFETRYGQPPPKPYVLTRPEHTHYLGPPNWPME